MTIFSHFGKMFPFSNWLRKIDLLYIRKEKKLKVIVTVLPVRDQNCRENRSKFYAFKIKLLLSAYRPQLLKAQR